MRHRLYQNLVKWSMPICFGLLYLIELLRSLYTGHKANIYVILGPVHSNWLFIRYLTHL